MNDKNSENSGLNNAAQSESGNDSVRRHDSVEQPALFPEDYSGLQGSPQDKDSSFEKNGDTSSGGFNNDASATYRHPTYSEGQANAPSGKSSYFTQGEYTDSLLGNDTVGDDSKAPEQDSLESVAKKVRSSWRKTPHKRFIMLFISLIVFIFLAFLLFDSPRYSADVVEEQVITIETGDSEDSNSVTIRIR